MQHDSTRRLAALRTELGARGLDGLIVPRADEHLGEYAPSSSERLAWLTGFTGSAGLAVVLHDRAAVFSDGRYVLQLAQQTDGALYERLHLTETPPRTWLANEAERAGRTLRIGYDPRLVSEDELQRLEADGIILEALEQNPIDAIWTDRPSPPMGRARAHPEALAGRGSGEKRAEIAETLRAARQDAAVLTDPASIAWLLNIRGEDLPATQVALGFAIIHADAQVELFMEPSKLDAALRATLGNGVAVAPPSAMAAALASLEGKRVRVDRGGAPSWFAQTLAREGATPVAGADPCLGPKSRKTDAEQDGAREAHRRDAVALVKFLRWIEGEAGRATEISAADRLRAFRAEDPAFLAESFPAISGSGPNGAIIHYHATAESDRRLEPAELYLIDSGGQYEMGTTDVTRTVWTGGAAVPEPIRAQFTCVLKGHIAIATAIFPEGVTGHRLDALARIALWKEGLDYDHGTGHGVGSVLSVHEGPASIAPIPRPAPIEAGMILSDEPGFYAPGAYGIRIENLLLVHPVAFPEATRQFLGFETLTLAPIDRRCIAPARLTGEERAWVDAYHARVLREIGPALDDESRAWLARACAALDPD